MKKPNMDYEISVYAVNSVGNSTPVKIDTSLYADGFVPKDKGCRTQYAG